MTDKPVWDKPRPKGLGKPSKLSSGQKSKAKAAAKAAGRPYPNLIDNMRAARAFGGYTYAANNVATGMDSGGPLPPQEQRQGYQMGGMPMPPAPNSMGPQQSQPMNNQFGNPMNSFGQQTQNGINGDPIRDVGYTAPPPFATLDNNLPPPQPVQSPVPSSYNPLMSNTPPAPMADGGEVKNALRVAKLRLNKYDGGGVEGEVSFAPEEKPDYEKASQFEQEQLHSGEPQLPQMDREAYNKWKYGASDALHGMAYLHPATAPMMGAYDLGHGAATGNPREIAGAMFGLPSRVAKAIATAAFAEQPESEGASPASKLMSVAKDRMADGGIVDEALRLTSDDTEAKPDYEKSSDFEREQLNSGEPQVRQYNPEGGLETAKEAGRFMAGMTTPGAIADAAGYLGGPSALENYRAGNKGEAALQVAGALPVVGPLAKAGMGAHLAMSLAPKARIADESVRDALKLAAQKLGSETSREGYQDLINQIHPVRPYESVPIPATTEEMLNALHTNKKEKVGLGSSIAEGHPVGLRLDIPAYTEHDTWVPTIHDTKNNNKVLAHEGAARILNPVFDMSQSKALKIAQGGAKNPFATINGNWSPTTSKEAHALAQEALNNPDWRQVGMDPTRHSYFYDRHTQEPITHAEEAVQVGPLVLAKNPRYGKREDYHYARGGDVEDALRLASGGGAWTRKEGKNMVSGGLNAKGRASLKAQGHDIKPPAPHPKTEKDAGRRKSFCARMSGMEGPMKDEKGRPTRKALSLKAWNC